MGYFNNQADDSTPTNGGAPSDSAGLVVSADAQVDIEIGDITNVLTTAHTGLMTARLLQ